MLKKSIAVLLVCLLLPVMGLAETEEERIAALEARVEALEEALAALQADDGAVAEPQERETVTRRDLGGTFAAAQDVEVSVTDWDFLNWFRYYPSGSFSSRTVSASDGYQLVSVSLTAVNAGRGDFAIAKLLEAEITYGDDYAIKAEDTFFYQQSQGVYASGLRTLGGRASVSGCLLFALPEEALNTEKAISLRFEVDDVVYEYTLREGENPLPIAGNETQF